MQFDDRFGDCEPHSRTLDHHALVPAAIELLENHLLLHFVDPRTVIRHTYDHFGISQFGSDMNRSLGWRVLSCVIQEVHNYFSDPFEIHSDWRKVPRNGDFNSMASQ